MWINITGPLGLGGMGQASFPAILALIARELLEVQRCFLDGVI
jgi:hypothetical protein